MTTAKRLRRAAEILRKTGWCQQIAYTPDGRCCLQEAVIRACPGKIGNAFALLRKVTRWNCITAWNDSSSRTKRQVLSALERAADLAGANSAPDRQALRRRPG